MAHPFYADGLRFSCARCSSCCRHESGFVYLSEEDAGRLADALRVARVQFERLYCRWVPWERGAALSLKEKSNYDCVFWDNGCSVYESRPLQCRAFPFWEAVLASESAWEQTARDCPGMNTGAVRSAEEIAGFLAARRDQPVIEREARW